MGIKFFFLLIVKAHSIGALNFVILKSTLFFLVFFEFLIKSFLFNNCEQHEIVQN